MFMDWKKLFIPSISKILLTLLMLILSCFRLKIEQGVDTSFSGRGFPITFFNVEHWFIGAPSKQIIVWQALLFDLIFYYLISVILVYLYNLIRKNK